MQSFNGLAQIVPEICQFWFYQIKIQKHRVLVWEALCGNKELTMKIHREAWLFCNNLPTNHIENFSMAECPRVKTWNFECRCKISCSFSSCHPNFHQQFHNGVTVTDLMRDMSVTEELGGVRNNHAWKKVLLRGFGESQWHEIWSICPSSSPL